jgi:hypothetical protein
VRVRGPARIERNCGAYWIMPAHLLRAAIFSEFKFRI